MRDSPDTGRGETGNTLAWRTDEPAFRLHEAELRALTVTRRINVQPWLLVKVVARALPHIFALRPQMLEVAAGFDLGLLDALPSLFAAFRYVDARTPAKRAPVGEPHALHARALKVRRQLLSVKNSLVELEASRAVSLKALTMDTGYRNLADDLMVLSSFFLEQPELLARTPLTPEFVHEAAGLAEAVLDASTQRHDSRTVHAEALLLRRQAFTRLLDAYEEARELVWLLRRSEGDGPTLVPRLLASRALKRKPREPSAQKRQP